MRLFALLRNLFHRSRVERELDDEVRSYYEMLVGEKIAAGGTPETARREAAIETGGVEHVKECVRDVRMGALVEQLLQDLKYGARTLRRKPLFAFVAIATLAIGIGANAAIFTVVNAVLLRPLPFASPERLFAITGMSYTGEFVELQRRARTFDAASYVDRQVTLTGGGEPERIQTAFVSPNTFAMLGVAAALGRPLAEGDEQARDGAVIVLSHRLWLSRFGGDRTVVGRRIVVDGVSRTVVGVMPADIGFPSADTMAWLPASINMADRIALWSTGLRMIGRLRAGTTLAQADAELKALAPAMRPLFPWSMPAGYGTEAAAVPLHAALTTSVRSMLLMLLGAVGVVLLIASVNISNLLVARTLARQRELAVRAARGAGRGRILRQVLTEGVLLVALGAAAGLPLAYAGVEMLAAWLPADMPRAVGFTIDGRLLAFALSTLAGSALIIGILPALRASTVDLVPQLVEGERTGHSYRTRLMSNLLVGAQVALAVLLVITAVLLVRSLGNLYAVAPGFRAENVVAARISPPPFRFRDSAARREFYRAVLERVSAAPHVVNVAVTDRLPFAGEIYGSVFIIEGRPSPVTTGDWPIADVAAVVSPGFFSTMAIPLREGRTFGAADTEASQPVAIVSDSLARQYWPGESAVGRRFSFAGNRTGMRTIVGVVDDVKWERVTDAPKGALFLPLAQGSPGAMRIVVRTSSSAAATLDMVRTAVQGLDRDTPVDQAHSMDGLIAGSVEQPRFMAALLSAFALTGLLLGAMGIYGTVADQVRHRRREIGVRMALGARTADVLRTVLGGTFLVVLLGALAGLAAAAAVTRLFAAMLFEVTAIDPLTFVAAALILAVTAGIGAYLPARRAAALDPLAALRGD